MGDGEDVVQPNQDESDADDEIREKRKCEDAQHRVSEILGILKVRTVNNLVCAESIRDTCKWHFDASLSSARAFLLIVFTLSCGCALFLVNNNFKDKAPEWAKATADVMIVALGLSSTLLTQSANSKSLRNADLWSRFTRCQYTKAFYMTMSRLPKPKDKRDVYYSLARSIQLVPIFCVHSVQNNGEYETDSNLQILLSDILLFTKAVSTSKTPPYAAVVFENAIISMCSAANELVAEAQHPAYPAGISIFVFTIFTITVCFLPAKFEGDDFGGAIPTVCFIFIIFAPLIITYFSQVPFCKGKNGLHGGQSVSAEEDLLLALNQNLALVGQPLIKSDREQLFCTGVSNIAAAFFSDSCRNSARNKSFEDRKKHLTENYQQIALKYTQENENVSKGVTIEAAQRHPAVFLQEKCRLLGVSNGTWDV